MTTGKLTTKFEDLISSHTHTIDQVIYSSQSFHFNKQCTREQISGKTHLNFETKIKEVVDLAILD